jgi:FHA domain
MTDPTDPPEHPSSDAEDLKARIEAERTGIPFLFWKNGNRQQEIKMLTDDVQRLAIGRGRDQDITLAWDPQVSRSHALLERAGGEWFVEDRSRNGTHVNGSPISKPHRLEHKAGIVFGATRVTYWDVLSEAENDSTVRTPEERWAPITDTQRRVLLELCRPVYHDPAALPASNRHIGDEVSLGVDAVKAHLRGVYRAYGLDTLPQMEKRTKLARLLLANGTFQDHDF